MDNLKAPRPGNRDNAIRAYDGALMVWRWNRLPQDEEDERPAYGWMLVEVRYNGRPDNQAA